MVVENHTGGNEKILATRFFIIGCILLAAAIGFAAKLLDVECPTVIHMVLLKWILPLASGFAVWSFAGAIKVEARGIIQCSVITATGGFGVWLVSIFVLIPNEDWGSNCKEVEPVIDITRSSELKVENCGNEKIQLVEIIEDNHVVVEGVLKHIKVLGFENHQGGAHNLAKIEYFNGEKWEEVFPLETPISPKTMEVSANVQVINNSAKVRYTWVQDVTDDKEFGLGIRKPYIISKIDAQIKFPHNIPFSGSDTSWINSIEPKYCVKSVEGNVFTFSCGKNGMEMRLDKNTTYGASWEWAPQAACS